MELQAQCYSGLQTLAVPTHFVAGSPVFSKGFPRTPRSPSLSPATAAEALLRPLETARRWRLPPDASSFAWRARCGGPSRASYKNPLIDGERKSACAAKLHSKAVRVPKDENLLQTLLLLLFL